MTSIKTVAQRAQVSIATVSRVLNGTKYVSPDIKQRVLEAVEALNYHPNAPARNLRRQRTQSIGVLIPQLNDLFFSDLAYVLEKSLFAAGYTPLFCSTENDEEKEMMSVDNFINHRVDGVILIPSVPGSKSVNSVERLLERQIPIVLVDRAMPEFQVNQVIINNQQGGYSAADYLLRLGHRHIGVVDAIGEPARYIGEPGYERTSGVQQAMLAHGVLFDNRLVIMDRLGKMEMGYHGALRLLRQSSHVTAIFALTDAIAVGVLRAASELGLHVPRDLSVIGFDDMVLASHVTPRLTTVAQPIENIGQTATRLLLGQIQASSAPPETVILETKLVIRESTAPPR